MRAVNLIPADQQRGAGGVAGKSSGGVYVLLGALALLVVMATAYFVSGKSVDDKKAELADVTQQATAAEAKASSLTSYTRFSAVRAKRVETVSQLADGRFDWAHALREVSRVLPENTWLTQLTGTSSSSVSVAGAGGSQLRSSLDVPAIQMQGCTTSQASVAALIARLRLIDGVQRVSLEDSTKGQESANASGTMATASSGGGDCRGGHAKFPVFNIDVFFAQAAAPPAAGTGTAGSSTSASSSTPASTATPASTSVQSSGGTKP